MIVVFLALFALAFFLLVQNPQIFSSLHPHEDVEVSDEDLQGWMEYRRARGLPEIRYKDPDHIHLTEQQSWNYAEYLGWMCEQTLAQNRVREEAERQPQPGTTNHDELVQLLEENWRAMRGYPLEGYLERVLIAQGYIVDAIGQAGDQGADLIAEKDGERLAIQVKGYTGAVSNKAVQEALAGSHYHGCDRPVVITNSVFTNSAVALAKSVNCNLVDEHDFEKFVAANFSL